MQTSSIDTTRSIINNNNQSIGPQRAGLKRMLATCALTLKRWDRQTEQTWDCWFMPV